MTEERVRYEASLPPDPADLAAELERLAADLEWAMAENRRLRSHLEAILSLLEGIGSVPDEGMALLLFAEYTEARETLRACEAETVRLCQP